MLSLSVNPRGYAEIPPVSTLLIHGNQAVLAVIGLSRIET
jgi:hypothetical protein